MRAARRKNREKKNAGETPALQRGHDVSCPYQNGNGPTGVGARFLTRLTIPQNKILSSKVRTFLKKFFSLLFSVGSSQQKFAVERQQKGAKAGLKSRKTAESPFERLHLQGIQADTGEEKNYRLRSRTSPYQYGVRWSVKKGFVEKFRTKCPLQLQKYSAGMSIR